MKNLTAICTLFIFAVFSAFLVHAITVKPNTRFKIEQDSGNIEWESSAIKATTNTKWIFSVVGAIRKE